MKELELAIIAAAQALGAKYYRVLTVSRANVNIHYDELKDGELVIIYAGMPTTQARFIPQLINDMTTEIYFMYKKPILDANYDQLETLINSAWGGLNLFLNKINTAEPIQQYTTEAMEMFDDQLIGWKGTFVLPMAGDCGTEYMTADVMAVLANYENLTSLETAALTNFIEQDIADGNWDARKEIFCFLLGGNNKNIGMRGTLGEPKGNGWSNGSVLPGTNDYFLTNVVLANLGLEDKKAHMGCWAKPTIFQEWDGNYVFGGGLRSASKRTGSNYEQSIGAVAVPNAGAISVNPGTQVFIGMEARLTVSMIEKLYSQRYSESSPTYAETIHNQTFLAYPTAPIVVKGWGDTNGNSGDLYASNAAWSMFTVGDPLPDPEKGRVNELALIKALGG